MQKTDLSGIYVTVSARACLLSGATHHVNFCTACSAGTATHTAATTCSVPHTDGDYSLDDDELLALAATQLDEA